MKKIKIIIPLLLLALLLSGCGALDEMRAQHALNYDDGTIVYNEKTYKRVENSNIKISDYFSVEWGKNLYITAPDVPVLLSQFTIVKHQPYINTDFTVIIDGDYYVREDLYQDIFAETIHDIFSPTIGE